MLMDKKDPGSGKFSIRFGRHYVSLFALFPIISPIVDFR